MSLISKIIKGGLHLNQALSFELDEPAVQQERQLRSLLEKAKDTAFGKFHGFEKILESSDIITAYQRAVPIFDYHEMYESWWHKQLELPDITWPSKPDYFALSSGTTGKSSKRIPITDDFLKSMRDVGASLIKTIPDFNFPESLFESEILMLSSSANLSKNDNGHLEGEISGINVSNFPDWYDLFYRPGIEIAAISDWDERVQRIAEEAPKWNIGVIAGIPSWVLLMLKKVIEHNGLETIHDIWPNLTVFSSGGVAFETYRQDFEAITAKPLTIIDTYLASEGFFAYTARPGTMDMRLALDHGYFYEFIPFDERGVDSHGGLLDEPMIHTISQVEVGQEYVLIISSCAGAWRYQIGDVVKFTQLDPPEIKITGRTKFFLNVVGSQLSEEKMDEAILDTAKSMGVTMNEYMVAALKNDDGDYYHQWLVVCDSSVDANTCRDRLDKALQDANKNYGVARKKALKEVRLSVIPKALYHDYLDNSKKKGGQVKTPKVVDDEKMYDFLDFIEARG